MILLVLHLDVLLPISNHGSNDAANDRIRQYLHDLAPRTLLLLSLRLLRCGIGIAVRARDDSGSLDMLFSDNSFKSKTRPLKADDDEEFFDESHAEENGWASGEQVE